MIYAITREEEHQLPDFSSLKEAVTYFEKRYGKKNFVYEFQQYDENTDMYINFYKLKDMQPVEVWDNGMIHIVY